MHTNTVRSLTVFFLDFKTPNTYSSIAKNKSSTKKNVSYMYYVLENVEVPDTFTQKELLHACLQAVGKTGELQCSRSFSIVAQISEESHYEAPIENPVHFSYKIGGYLHLGLLTKTPEPYEDLRYTNYQLKMKKKNWDMLPEPEKNAFNEFKEALKKSLLKTSGTMRGI